MGFTLGCPSETTFRRPNGLLSRVPFPWDPDAILDEPTSGPDPEMVVLLKIMQDPKEGLTQT